MSHRNEPSISEATIVVDTTDGTMSVLRKRPAEPGEWPTVVMFHDGPGLREATHVFVRKLAAAGFDVIVPDLYHRHGDMIGFGPDRSADPAVREQIWGMIASLTDEGIQSDLDSAITVLDPVPARMACLGFCLGARAVYRTMQARPDAFPVGAMWHPSFLVDDEEDSPHLDAASLPGELYVGFGEADKVMPVDSMRPFIDAVSTRPSTTLIDVHPGADHGFTWPDSPTHDAAAADLSFDRTTTLFAAVLDR